MQTNPCSNNLLSSHGSIVFSPIRLCGSSSWTMPALHQYGEVWPNFRYINHQVIQKLCQPIESFLDDIGTAYIILLNTDE